MTKLKLILICAGFMGNLFSLPLQVYKSDVHAFHFGCVSMAKLNSKEEKIKNIDQRVKTLEKIKENAIKDTIFLNKNGVIEDNIEILPTYNDNRLMPMGQRFANSNLDNDISTIQEFLKSNGLTAKEINLLLKNLNTEKAELSKVTFFESLQNKYNQIMKPIKLAARPIANWSSLGAAAIIAYDLYYNKCEYTQASIVQKSTSLFATLAIISHYLRK